MRKVSTVFLLLVLVLLSACGSKSSSGSGGSITIGTQTFSEVKILAHMYKELIEDSTDISVTIKPDLPTSPVIIEAMDKDEIQMSTHYTGTALESYFGVENPESDEATLEQAKRDFGKEFNFKWFDSLGFAIDYSFTVRRDIAEKYNLKTISDLEDIAGDMTAAFDTNWKERKNDGYDAFIEKYGFEFGKVRPMEIGLVYDAVKNEDVDIAVAYSTDARIRLYDLVILEDDKSLFPPYDASPVVKQETIDEYPEIADAIEPLLGRIDLDTIQRLNGEVDIEGKDPEEVAVNYLKEQGLLE
ncbi:glycine betaine ABC transporter substrate-binding protein [Siminovitchia sediminis]|uniref:Glycine betaine ABC transporter substrate-binding protein n=1 Tax=Siminovitchia sediminis TaxID=1274353 RepID=A0ABW4KLL9_9BACI